MKKEFGLSSLLMILCMTIAGCSKSEKARPAHFRALSVIHHTDAKLNIQGKGKNKNIHITLSLPFAEGSNNYHTFPQGYYEMTLSVHGKKLLMGTYVLGKDGYYTLLAKGILPEKWKVNPQTTMHKLKYIFAGEDIKSTNSYLPVWKIMRDNYDGSKSRAYIRLVNGDPFAATVTIKKDGKSLLSGLAYPLESGMLKLKPGKHTLQFLYGRVELLNTTISVKPGYVYSAILSNNEGNTPFAKVTVLKNKSQALLQ